MALAQDVSVGFVGLGLMGAPMARQLVEKLPPTAKLHIYDINPEAISALVAEDEKRVYAAESARQVAERSDVIITMVPEGAHVRAVYLTPDTGICAATNLSGKLLIDSSTIDVATSSAVSEALLSAHPDAHFYDAPVSGGVRGAQAGTIAFFLGCDPSDPNLSRATALLELMGKSIIPCGAPGLGLAAKLSNNYLSGIIAIAASEALDMGMRAGLDPRVLCKVFAAGTAQNKICDDFCPCPGVVEGAPSTNDYQGGFKVQLMRKDFGLAVDMARRTGAGNVLGDIGLETYTKAMADERCKDRDSRVVYRYLGGDEKWMDKYKDQ